MKSAKNAIRTNGTRIAIGSSGNSRASFVHCRPTLANSRGATVCSMVETMVHLLGQANAGVDIRIENVDDEIDDYDHDPGFHDDALHEREIALKDALVEQSANTGPGKDHLDDDRGVDHDDKVYPRQGQHWYQGILESV